MTSAPLALAKKRVVESFPGAHALWLDGRQWTEKRRVRSLIPPPPPEAIVPLEEADIVMLQRSASPWAFSPQVYAQESAFAHALSARGLPFAVTDRPDQIFEKSVVWFVPDLFVEPRLWDYSRQLYEFAQGLERQGNALFCSSAETAYWENKVHMHRMLDEVRAPAPRTVIISAHSREAAVFDMEPVLIKQEHSASSAGIYHFETAAEARAFVEAYPFRPTESLVMQEVVRGATRDMRVTVVGDRVIDSATYWRVKSAEALGRAEWTTTATTFGSTVEHGEVPASAASMVIDILRQLRVRTAGIDLMWVDDDQTREPVILEFSPYYQPNPPKPARFAHLSYKEFKQDRLAEGGYLSGQWAVFREIAESALDQGLLSTPA